MAIILQLAGAVFEVVSAEQAEPEMINAGYCQLIVKRTKTDNCSEFEISIA